MVVPKFEDFLMPTLKGFADNEIHTKKELSEKNAKYFNLSDEDLKETTAKGNKTKYKDRTDWAVTHIFKAGLLEKSNRGEYKISEEGMKVLNQNIKYIDMAFLEKYDSYIKYRNAKDRQTKNNPIHQGSEITNGEVLSPTDRLEEAYNEINKELSDELYDIIMNNSPRFFEKLVVKLLVKMGYGLDEDSGQITPYTKDGGIDGIIYEDELGLSQIHIQAKQHTNPIGQNDMKNFAYTLEHGISKGVMITTSSFTSGAIEISKESNAQIVLIDGKKLTQLMIKHNVGVFTEYNYSIKKIDKDFFEEE